MVDFSIKIIGNVLTGFRGAGAAETEQARRKRSAMDGVKCMIMLIN
jgi:hypothetical protein